MSSKTFCSIIYDCPIPIPGVASGATPPSPSTHSQFFAQFCLLLNLIDFLSVAKLPVMPFKISADCRSHLELNLLNRC